MKANQSDMPAALTIPQASQATTDTVNQVDHALAVKQPTSATDLSEIILITRTWQQLVGFYLSSTQDG